MSLNQTLKRIMFEKQIRTAALARELEMPQPTLHRIVEGACRPHRSSLERLAHHFDVTINQLEGLEPIPWLENSSTLSSCLIELPILAWDTLHQWPTILGNCSLIPTLEKTAISRKKVGIHAFSTRLEDASMEPHFVKGTTLIVDPDKAIKDRCFLIVHLKKTQETVFRQLVLNGHHHYLKPLSVELQSFPLTKMQKDDKMIGVLVQAQQDFSQ